MLENKQLKKIGFTKAKGSRKEWYQSIHPEVVLLIKGEQMYVLSQISAAFYITGGHLLLSKEDYDKWLNEQPDKHIGNHTMQMLEHTMKVLKESFQEQ